MTPRPGDLVFVRGKGFIPWAIRQVTGGHYNHVEIYIGNGEAIGAEYGEGVRRVKISEHYKGQEVCICRCMPLGDANALAIAKQAELMAGGEYDTRGLLGVWFRFALKWIGYEYEIPQSDFGRGAKFYCSEMVAWLYATKEIIFATIHFSLITPTEIFESSINKIVEE